MSTKPLLMFFSSGLAKIKNLQHFYPENTLISKSSLQGFGLYLSILNPSQILKTLQSPAGILTWGKKSRFAIDSAIAKKMNTPLIYLEDGFLRSIEPATNAPLSLVKDEVGIYYDASTSSSLEIAINNPLNQEQESRAKSIAYLWQDQQVSKYNHAPNITPIQIDKLTEGKPFLLLIDQTYGDKSIEYGFATPRSFETMLNHALAQQEIEKIIVKVHPEVVRGKKRGYLSENPLLKNPRIGVIDYDIHLPSLFSKTSAVYTVTSQSGFEALLWNRPVHTFGMPFYAGWGLTLDQMTPPTRRKPVTLEQLIYASLVRYPRYLDPETEKLCEVENTIAYLGLQRKKRGRFDAPLLAPDFSQHKLIHLKRFTQGAHWHDKQFIPTKGIPSITLSWGALNRPIELDRTCQQIQVEDGFLRSIGLGALLAKPFSWVFDQTGMYYDATRPSDLETLLEHHSFSPALIERAQLLQQLIVRLGLTKYNQTTTSPVQLTQELEKFNSEIRAVKNRGQKVILAIGQVETDASIRLGGIDILSNSTLLKTIRERHPGAILIYKPHPDVVEGVRSQKGNGLSMSKLYDILAPNQSLPVLLKEVDEVHTISSLGGFEALLRGKAVYCYGMPFYAGWGLTVDLYPCIRRTRRLTLPELIVGSLIMYPTYLHPKTGAYCTPESLIYALSHLREQIEISNPKYISLTFIKSKITYWFMRYYHQIKGL
jgi:capsular polysaccharide export protein